MLYTVYAAITLWIASLFKRRLQPLAATAWRRWRKEISYTVLGGGALLLLMRIGFGWIGTLIGALTAGGAYGIRMFQLYRHVQHLKQLFGQEQTRAKYTPATTTQMTYEEARLILNVTEQATPEEIQDAYHRLMKRVHPDVGGSHYLAEKLNQARSMLLPKKS